MNGAFMIRNNNHNLRNFQCLCSTNKRIVKYGTETFTYRGPQIWNLVPEKTKNASSFDLFKKEIGKWKGEKCPCRICKTYIQHVGLFEGTVCTSYSLPLHFYLHFYDDFYETGGGS